MQRRRVDALQADDLDLVDARRRRRGQFDARATSGVLGLADAPAAASRVAHVVGRRAAAVGGLGIALEVAGGDAVEIGLDVDVGRLAAWPANA